MGPGLVNFCLSLLKNNYIRRISEQFDVHVIVGATIIVGSKKRLCTPLVRRCQWARSRIDPIKNPWSKRGPMPTARNHAAIGVVNGKIYVIAVRGCPRREVQSAQASALVESMLRAASTRILT